MAGEKEKVGRHSGEPTGTPPSGRTESLQPFRVSKGMVLKSELSLFQKVSDSLEQAGHDTYKFTIEKRQVDPKTRRRLAKDSPYVAVTYSAPEYTGNLFWWVVDRAKTAQKNAADEGRPQEEIDQAVQSAILSRIPPKVDFKTVFDIRFEKSGQ